jgi:uncharacterized protein (DUF1330 family)
MDIQITDVVRYEEYRKLVPPIIEKYGGKYLARGGPAWNAEGNWEPERVVILEFESAAIARQFLNSEEYAPVKKIRHAASDGKGIVVEGV